MRTPSRRTGARSTRVRPGAFHSQSLYKHGWSLFKQGRNEESPAVVRQRARPQPDRPGATARGFAPVEQMSRPDRELVEDTLRVMSITFSYLDGAELARPVRDQARRAAVLATCCTRGSATSTSRSSATRTRPTPTGPSSRATPADENAPILAMQAIEAYRKGGFDQLVLEGKRDYVERYNFSGGFWQGRERADYPQVVSELKTQHEGRRDLLPRDGAEIEARRRLPGRLALVPATISPRSPTIPSRPQTNYLLAETLFEGGQFRRCGNRVRAHGLRLSARTAFGRGRLCRRSAPTEAARRDARGAAGRTSSARQIDAGIRFAQAFPEHPDSGGVITRAAQDLFDRKDLAARDRGGRTWCWRTSRRSMRRSSASPGRSSASRTSTRATSSAPRRRSRRRASWRRPTIRCARTSPSGSPPRCTSRPRRAAAEGDAAGAVDAFLRVARAVAGSDGPRDGRVRRRGAAADAQAVGSGDPGARRLPARLPAGRAPAGRHAQPRRGLFRGRVVRRGGVRSSNASPRIPPRTAKCVARRCSRPPISTRRRNDGSRSAACSSASSRNSRRPWGRRSRRGRSLPSTRPRSGNRAREELLAARDHQGGRHRRRGAHRPHALSRRQVATRAGHAGARRVPRRAPGRAAEEEPGGASARRSTSP